MKRALEFFNALADETRLSIVLGLREGPKTVNEIHQKLGTNKLTISAVSHQLKLLFNTDIVTFKKSGRKRIYDLSDSFCWCILNSSLQHTKTKRKCPTCSKIKKENKK